MEGAKKDKNWISFKRKKKMEVNFNLVFASQSIFHLINSFNEEGRKKSQENAPHILFMRSSR